MKNKICYALFISLILTCSLFAQEHQVQLKGVVIETGGQTPLPGTTLVIEELQKGTMSDKYGEFTFSKLPDGDYTLLIKFLGYETQRRQVHINSTKSPKNLIIKMKPEDKSLEELIVIGKSEVRKIREQAMPVSVISMKQLQGTVSSVQDILTKTVGVTIRSTGAVGSASRLSVRGLEGKRIGFFIDETPMNEHSDFINVNDIPVDMIERIEIYKGVVPAKFGGSAVGGAVNIVIKEYPPRYLDASYSIESFRTHKISTVLKRNFIKQGIELGGGGFYTYAKNNYTMESPYQKGLKIERDHDRFKNIVGALNLKARKWWFDEVEMELVYLNNKKQIQGILQNIREAHSASKAYVCATSLKKKDFLLEGLDFELSNSVSYTKYNFVDTASYRYTWDMQAYPAVSIYGGEIGVAPSNSTLKQFLYGNKTNISYLINEQHALNLNLLGGYTSAKPSDPLKDKSIGHKTNFDTKSGHLVLGLGHEYKSPNDIIVNALTAKYYYYSMRTTVSDLFGLKLQDIDLAKHNWGISEAIRYRFTPKFLTKASLAYEVRLPTEKELIGDGFFLMPSGDLNPERGANANLGFLYDKGTKGKLFQVELNFFASYLKDMIRYTRDFVQGHYTNFGEMRSLGVEAEVKADLSNTLYGYINATYQDLRDVRAYEVGSSVPNATKGLRMPNIPYLLANAGLEFHKADLFGIKESNFRLYTDASYTHEYFFDFEESKFQEKRIPSSLNINLGLEYSILNGRITFSAKVGNLMNATLLSEFNHPLPGRTFGARVRYVLK